VEDLPGYPQGLGKVVGTDKDHVYPLHGGDLVDPIKPQDILAVDYHHYLPVGLLQRFTKGTEPVG